MFGRIGRGIAGLILGGIGGSIAAPAVLVIVVLVASGMDIDQLPDARRARWIGMVVGAVVMSGIGLCLGDSKPPLRKSKSPE